MRRPIFWTPRNGGQWILQGHAANFDAARDTEAFSSEIMPHEQVEAILAQLPPDMPHIPRAYPINLDPPTSRQVSVCRCSACFRRRRSIPWRAVSGQLAGELIDKVVDQGQCEFMAAIAEPLPVQVFLKMLGLPLEKLPEYRALVKEHLSETDPDLRQVDTPAAAGRGGHARHGARAPRKPPR